MNEATALPTTDDYTGQIEFASSPSAVYEALTTLENLAGWWSKATGSGQVGGELRFFFADGMLIGSWAGRIPAVQQHASLTNARLGLALFAFGSGPVKGFAVTLMIGIAARLLPSRVVPMPCRCPWSAASDRAPSSCRVERK